MIKDGKLQERSGIAPKSFLTQRKPEAKISRKEMRRKMMKHVITEYLRVNQDDNNRYYMRNNC